MYTGFLYQNLDYIYFLSGFFLLALAVICRFVGSLEHKPRRSVWILISICLILSLDDWMNIFFVSVPEGVSERVTTFRLFCLCTVMLMSFFLFDRSFRRLRILLYVSRAVTILTAVGILGALACDIDQVPVMDYFLLFSSAIVSLLFVALFTMAGAGKGRLIQISSFVCGVCLAGNLALYAQKILFYHQELGFLTASYDNYYYGLPSTVFRSVLIFIAVMASVLYYAHSLRERNFLTSGKVTRAVFIILLTAMIPPVFGFFCVVMLGDAMRDTMKQALIGRTALLSASVSHRNVHDLVTMKPSEAREKLRTSIEDVFSHVSNSQKDVRYVYLLSRTKDGRYVFEVDTEPLSYKKAKDYYDPGAVGEEYDDTDGAVKSVFERKEATVFGPHFDGFGYFVSGFVPIYVPGTSLDVQAVAAMDIEAKNWNSVIYRFRFYPLMLTLFLSLLVILMSAEIVRRRLTDIQLRRAKAEADEANAAKSDFLSNMSHELRTPLNAIIGFSEVMNEGMCGKIENPQYAEYISLIHSSGKHLLSLINDILDLSKIEAGRMTLDIQKIDVSSVFSDVFQISSGYPSADKYGFVRKAAPDPLVLHADERMLKQVLLNLLSNAIKFSEPGTTIEMSAEATCGGAIIRVIDQGIGISKENLKKIMQPFSQLESAMVRKYQGTGLGLALTKKIVELHGGTISISSEPGKGTTVTVFLPDNGKKAGGEDEI